MARPRLLFRWTQWNVTTMSLEMLGHSIGTFRRFFGDAADYIVFTDDIPRVEAGLSALAKVEPMNGPGADYLAPRAFNPDSQVPWAKWAPRLRHDPDATEIYVDSDVFLLARPTEILEFVEGDGTDFLVTQEEEAALWPYGAFKTRLPAGFAPVNTGLLGQRAGRDLTARFRAAFDWWQAEVPDEQVNYYDEQGAMTMVLHDHIPHGRVRLLDAQRYRVVCQNNDPPVETVDGLVAMHATFGPDHPAYQRFKREISASSGIAGVPEPAVRAPDVG